MINRMPFRPTLEDLETGSIVVFDTDCILCSRWVHFLLANERDTDLIFVRAWSATGQALAARHGLTGADLQRTYLVVDNGRALTRSAAGLALLRHLRAPWRWLGVLAAVPEPWRDRFYNWVATNRYSWFGRRADCFVPPLGDQNRFIQD